MNCGRKATHQSHTQICHIFESYTVFSFHGNKAVSGMLANFLEEGRNFFTGKSAVK